MPQNQPVGDRKSLRRIPTLKQGAFAQNLRKR